jgi:hypothetical protein
LFAAINNPVGVTEAQGLVAPYAPTQSIRGRCICDFLFRTVSHLLKAAFVLPLAHPVLSVASDR